MTLTAFKTLGDAQCAFVSLSENIDYSTPEGHLFLIMLAAFAQYFSDSLGKHASKAKRARARLGLPLGSAPFGYRNEGGKAVAVPEELRALRELVFDPFMIGHMGYSALAQSMNDAGWFTRSRNIMYQQKARGEEAVGGRWKADTVRFILQNAFYAGWVVDSVSGDRVVGQHPAVINEDEFQRIQSIIAERRRSRTPFASQVRRPDKFRSYPLRGLLRCALCGTTLGGVANKKHAKAPTERRRYIFYCGKRGNGLSCHPESEHPRSIS